MPPPPPPPGARLISDGGGDGSHSPARPRPDLRTAAWASRGPLREMAELPAARTRTEGAGAAAAPRAAAPPLTASSAPPPRRRDEPGRVPRHFLLAVNDLQAPPPLTWFDI
ncbi:hypothetical protein PAHAL_2G049900 [Panicum hallii]|uniref:Uncharacterized protein n=1 Tax=Panicum hallii TaxID=206008 RepID=A0A2S3GVZ4_9POAL|nr:hypothetical protein PAHAL_2G049900 [Panicum hallii]